MARAVKRLDCPLMATTAPHPWVPGPPNPVLAAGAVHVWQADLGAVGEEPSGLLCPHERARAERMLRSTDRQRWMRARGLLRVLLGGYLQEDPRVLRFAAGPHGKPTLAIGACEGQTGSGPPSVGARPSFNVSHSADVALYAFSDAGAVGVDVEVRRRAIDEVAIAARVLGPVQARRLEGLEPQARAREFRRAWVRHEAVAKCLGVGIGGLERAHALQAQPSVAELTMPEQAAAAVATERPARELCCWIWR